MQCASSTAKSAIRVPRELREEALVVEALRRDVEQLQRAGAEPLEDLALLVGVEARVEPRRRDPAPLQEVDLILHQRDQRRDDDRHARRAAAPAAGSRGSCPPPVGKTASADRPASSASTTRSWPGPKRVEAEPAASTASGSVSVSMVAHVPEATYPCRPGRVPEPAGQTGRVRDGAARARRGRPPRSRRRSSTFGRG